MPGKLDELPAITLLKRSMPQEFIEQSATALLVINPFCKLRRNQSSVPGGVGQYRNAVASGQLSYYNENGGTSAPRYRVTVLTRST